MTLVAIYSIGGNPNRTCFIFESSSRKLYKIERIGNGDWFWIEHMDLPISLGADLNLAKEKLKELIKT